MVHQIIPRQKNQGQIYIRHGKGLMKLCSPVHLNIPDETRGTRKNNVEDYSPVPIFLVQRLTFLLVEHLATEASQSVGRQHLFEQCVPAQFMLYIQHISL